MADGRVPPLRRPLPAGLSSRWLIASVQRLSRCSGQSSARTLAIEWGTSHHPGMTDIAAILPAQSPCNDSAAEQHIAWMLRFGAAWWNCFASLAGGLEVNHASPAKRERHAPAKAWLDERSG